MKSAKAAFGLSIIVMMTAVAPFAFAQAQHVRWDITNSSLTVPPIFTPGGVAFASARSGGAPSGLKIELTGSGTFVAPD